MSKLRDNPAKIVPFRVVIATIVLSIIIAAASMFLDFNLLITLIFFWLAAITNLIAFRLIVVGATRMGEKQAEGKKATMTPNLLIRYLMYAGVLIGAWFAGDLFTVAIAFIGVQLASIMIRLDGFVG